MLALPGGRRDPQPQGHRLGVLLPVPGLSGLPVASRCLEKPPSTHGRTVSKNDYEAEYQAARDRATPPAYAQVRQAHPKVERKFAAIVRFHGGRHARYRGRGRVAIQYLLTALVVNIKRMVKLLGEVDRPVALA